MATNDSNPAPTQAQITRKLVIRTALLLFVVAALIYGYNYWRGIRNDMSGGVASETAGMIAAVEYKKGGGQEAVIFRPDGTIIRNNGWHDGVTDRDATWSPDGNFVYFVSDRENNTFNVWRWSPDTGKVENRSLGTRGKSNPSFAIPGSDNGKTALLTSGGVVFEFDPADRSLRQVLPPTSREILQSNSEEAGGAEDQFAGSVYSMFGPSLAFRTARWFKGRDWVAGVLKRDNGEVLVAQKLTPNEKGALDPPSPIAAGEHIDFDVNPKTGGIVFTVNRFAWPVPNQVPKQFIKGNRITVPYRHAMGLFDPLDSTKMSAEQMKDLAKGGGDNGLVFASNNDQIVFITPKFSPDGSTVLAVAGPYDVSSEQVIPKAIVAIPAEVGGGRGGKPIVQGEVYEPSWSPDGNTIVFARRQAGHRTVFTVDSGGGSERNVSGEQGDFHNPQFSPQTK